MNDLENMDSIFYKKGKNNSKSKLEKSAFGFENNMEDPFRYEKKEKEPKGKVFNQKYDPQKIVTITNNTINKNDNKLIKDRQNADKLLSQIAIVALFISLFTL